MSVCAVRYSVDTSALLDGLRRHYPADIFVSLWSHIDELIAGGRVIASEEVFEELKVRDDEAKAWVEQRQHSLLIRTDIRITQEVRNILTAYPKLVKGLKGRNRADAFVIAVAKQHGCTVVTGEANDGNIDRPKIPFICKQLNIPCIGFLDLIQAEGWHY